MVVPAVIQAAVTVVVHLLAMVHPLVHPLVTEHRAVDSVAVPMAAATVVSVVANLPHLMVLLPDHPANTALQAKEATAAAAVVDIQAVRPLAVTELLPPDSVAVRVVLEAVPVVDRPHLTARRLGHLLATELLRLAVDSAEVVAAVPVVTVVVDLVDVPAPLTVLPHGQAPVTEHLQPAAAVTEAAVASLTPVTAAMSTKYEHQRSSNSVRRRRKQQSSSSGCRCARASRKLRNNATPTGSSKLSKVSDSPP